MNRRIVCALSICGAVMAASGARAAETPGSPRFLTDSLLGFLERSAANVAAATEELPESDLGFRPTPEVRTFGEIVGHVADSQRGLCQLAAGEEPRDSGWEKSATTRAALLEALRIATADCRALLERTDDAGLAAAVPFGGQPTAAGAVFAFAIEHTQEHYGNLVTYLRIRGRVPPTSRN